MRRTAAVHVLLAAYVTGLCWSLAWRPPTWTLVLATVGAVAATVAVARARASADGRAAALHVLLPLAAAFVCVGLAAGAARIGHLGQSRLAVMVGQSSSVDAVVLTMPSASGDRVNLEALVEAVDGRPLREKAHVTLELPRGEASPAFDSCGPLVEGVRVHLPEARIEGLPEVKPGRFDYGRYLERRGEHVVVAAPLESVVVSGRRGGVSGLVDRLRLTARAHLRRGLATPVRDVLEGMVLGNDEGVPADVIEDFRRSGLLHIMAVSGENVVLLCAIGTFALRALGVPRSARTVAFIPVVVVYVVVTGASPSIVRAGVAGVVVLLAQLSSRPSDGWLLWLLPAAWILSFNPYSLFDVSFQLSFAAVAGLLLLSRPLTRLFGFLPASLAEQAAVTSAATIATAPVSIATFGSASAVAVPANIAGGFVLGPIMLLGMMSVLAGYAGTWLSLSLNVAAGVFIGFLLTVTRLFGDLPFAVYEWRGPTLSLCLAGVGLGAVLIVRELSRRAGVGVLEYVRGRGRRGPLALGLATAVAVALVLVPAPPAAPAQPTVTFLNVGEGAATLAQAPGGPTILIDAGPEPLADTLYRHGVDRIDVLVLSHAHADHVAGLDDVVGAVPIGQALLPQPPPGPSSLQRLAGDLRAAGVPVRTCGTPLCVGGDGLEAMVLPTGGSTETGNQGENDLALVVVLGLGGERVLVPGDAEAEALGPLEIGPCAVVELPHHGSAGGLDQTLLEELRPRLAVISVGENSFGHPTAEMVALLAGAGVECLRTDQSGEVALVAEGDGLRVTAAPPSEGR